MSPLPTIRPERLDDVAAIRGVLVEAFVSSAEADLVDRLRDAGRLTLSLVAELDGTIVGHIAFSPVTVGETAFTPPALGLAPLSVLPEFQRRGIGAGLVEAALGECRRMSTPFAVVLGDSRYYARFGFERADERGLENGYGAGTDFRVIELTPGTLDGVTGFVAYAPEFDELT